MMPATFRWTDSAVCRALGLPGGDPLPPPDPPRAYERICTDTRILRRGHVSVALRGERFDGHDFIARAVQSGCGAVVADRDPGECPVPFYRVPDTLKALGDLALHRRLQSAVPVVGITGSSGKTTVKDLTLGALAASHRAHGTEANRNNRVGAPLTILSMPETATALVLELGTNEPGEIAELARIARPAIGVVTTVSETHVERLGDLGGVLNEKLDLLRPIGASAAPPAAIVGDEPAQLPHAARTIHPDVSVAGWSSAADPDLRPAAPRRRPDGTWTFSWMDHPVRLRIPGAHNVHNALLALAVARRLNVPPASAAAGVSSVGPGAMRGEVRRAGGLTLLVDCYNANAAGVAAAVTTLKGMAAEGRRVAVLGSMLELGERSAFIHRETLASALRSGIDRYVLTGAFARAAAELADELAPLAADRVHLVHDVDELADRLPELVGPRDTILLKASRGVRLERAIPVLESLGGGEGDA
ncbi:MAG: UDP-N-acetylmuramoyl-tripeptide--D-alanyl-D-alanine ligase [Gemmatimonadetes bacterium]|nr:UDP-N-acetylmuramoyl-tripeptide--D-alanyl-D-alanine ligase [Gemmatimonadota bacterium]